MENTFFAFISYKRNGNDKKIANWIHTKLEKYPYPKDLVASENRPNSNTIRRVFLDIKCLSTSPKCFTTEIEEAIKNSRYLIVLCSKKSAKSKFVNLEIKTFLETHNNDYNKILPVFIDEIDDDSLPEALLNSHILDRNCPIYNTLLSDKNETNQYCFYHIAAFLLNVDFRKIYDRYKVYATKKRKQRLFAKWTGIGLISLLILVLSFSVYESREISKLEKGVFPRSVVYGYMKNFLYPVINYFKDNNIDSKIHILMPIRGDELSHAERVEITKKILIPNLGLDSLRIVKLKTSMPRGSQIIQCCSDNEYNGLYLDFATTTSTFVEIAEYKKNSIFYKHKDIDDMILEYTDLFIMQAKDILKEDTIYVRFYKGIKEFVNELDR